MMLQIIGSGFGRTGTMSTKMALEELGFGPCHHMVEVMGNPDQPAHWNALAAGQDVDWAQVFAGYTSQVDFPGAAYWQDILAAFPAAKVIHTERPEDDWWEPLCHFLDVPPPATAFPRSNARDEFWALFGGEPVDAKREGA